MSAAARAGGVHASDAPSTANIVLPGHGWLPEPKLRFHPARPDDKSAHPLEGLLEFGPYSQATINQIMDPIRVAVIAPAGEVRVLGNLLRELEAPHNPSERPQYLRPFPGFSRIFRLRVRAARGAVLELPAEIDAELERSPRPHVALAERLTRTVALLAGCRSEYDVAILYLPERWSVAFKVAGQEDFDLHDYLKALTAIQDIPLQIVRDSENGALSYRDRCSVMWRLGIALYCKAGGVPWRLADADEGTAYVGLSYALKPNTAGGRPFVTCCSQVFDADGAGLEFIAYAPDDVQVEDGINPFLGRSEMRRVMARSLNLYQRRHAGRIPRRIVVHKNTEFKREEVDGCFDALRATDGIHLVQVQDDSAWRGVLIDPPRAGQTQGSPGMYPLLRGSYLPIARYETLIWTQGDVPEVAQGDHFYKEGKGIPAPLKLRRWAGHGGWEESCRDVLGLSKMDFNSDALYNRLPVTLGFAHTLAKVVKRMPRIDSRPLPVRLLM